MTAKFLEIHSSSLLDKIHILSRNLWWSWNFEAQSIFRELSPEAWDRTHHNPVALLAEMSREELVARLASAELAKKVESAWKNYAAYSKGNNTWASSKAKKLERPVAYFSAEFGFHESLRTYSGGLGILAGDHTKSASDLGIPFVGISLFYRQGYFEQRIAADGWQNEQYVSADPSKLPLRIVVDENGEPVRCLINIGFSTVRFHAWKLNVGRSVVFLLDTNVRENEERFRDLTAHVYGGDSTTRISQEIILGVGGVRLLRALGITPSSFHMNEGHSAFLTLELLREQVEKDIEIKTAEENVKRQCLFTTHTPVPAGHDRFSKDLMDYSLASMTKAMRISSEDLMNYGRVVPNDANETFCMTVLALKMARAANGVSELHGQVSREMWRPLFGNTAADKVPIGHITNGIHVGSWLNEKTERFWTTHLGKLWQSHYLEPDFWQKAMKGNAFTDEELWSLRYELRRDLVEFSRQALSVQHARFGNGTAVFEKVLNPDALTIGFSRRFATYKRAPLLFSDLERALELFNDPERPLQLIFAGKAHPRDDEGKKFIKKIIELTNHPRLFGKVVFLENYDINMARHLVAGADVWLNNPRRPLEASGTSGQKVVIHGGLNCSIMDGWWREGFNGTNGWAIGNDAPPATPERQDAIDAENLFSVIKNEIVPEFYERDEKNIPRHWLARIRKSIASLVPVYNTHRMVADYVKKYYV
ncbi:MAG TPA: alpha-glucan family phosphorylase [Bacteroidota bacterium]|nr:alpha-glucan family phosphorylase [Bacteroidota bacterium]